MIAENEEIAAPDFMVYEVANAIWRHEHLLKDLADGKPYLSTLWSLIDAGKITLIPPNEKLTFMAYSMARMNGIAIYDAIFVCLAIDSGMALKTFDKIQERTFESEKKKKREQR